MIENGRLNKDIGLKSRRGPVKRQLSLPASLVAAGIAFGALAAVAPSAVAQQSPAEPIRVVVSKAAILRLAGQAQNVIIGDPRVADITVENRSMLVLFGRSPGETNLIVLNAQQREILSVPIVVVAENDRHVSVVSSAKTGLTEIVYNCAERCIQLPPQTAGAAPSSGGTPQGPVPDAPAPPQAAAPAQAPAATDSAPTGKKGYKR